MILEFVVLYNLAFLKRVFPKGQFPKQRIYPNRSFSLGSVSRRRRHSIQAGAHALFNSSHTLWCSTAPAVAVSEELPFSFTFLMYLPHLLDHIISSLLGSWVFFSYPVIFACGCSICWMILTCWMIIVSRIGCYYTQNTHTHTHTHTHTQKAFYFSLNVAKT